MIVDFAKSFSNSDGKKKIVIQDNQNRMEGAYFKQEDKYGESPFKKSLP